jgi:hypothetical protein
VDFGLVELDPTAGFNVAQLAGKITRISKIADIGQGDAVDFFGFESRHVEAEVHECNIWKQLDINGVPTCFGDLLVLRDRHYSSVMTPIAQPGDSGAWIIGADEMEIGWDGVLIGGDGPHVYCSYAENIMTTVGPSYGLPP